MLQEDMTPKSSKVATYLERVSAYFVHPAVQKRLDCLLLMPWLLQNELNLDQGCQEPVPGVHKPRVQHLLVLRLDAR